MNDIKLALERQIADVTTMLTTLSDDKASSEAVELAITKAIQMSSNETLKEQENLKSEMTSELVALRLDLDEATKRLEEESTHENLAGHERSKHRRACEKIRVHLH